MKKYFEGFHPLVTFSYYVGALSLFMLMLHPIFLIVFLSLVVMFHFIHDRCRALQRWFFFIILTGMIIFIFNPLFNERGRSVLFEIFEHRVTLEAITFGAISAMSIMGVMALFVSYNEIMTPNKLLYLFSKFLPRFALLLMLTLRFIPLMRRRLEEIAVVQESKGISVRDGSWKKRASSGLLYIQVLLTYSMEEAIQTADSMKARGYGQGRRSSYELFVFRKKDGLALSFLISLFLMNVTGRFYEYGYLTIYPRMESLLFSGIELVILGSACLYMAFPVFTEMGGMIRWHKLN